MPLGVTMKTRITYYCEHCTRSFTSKSVCENHEQKCLERKIETEKLEGMFHRIMRNFENKGYTISIRYDSREKEDCIISVK